mmetsp:Transcript_17985/g.51074  ORF Transcript_17985/g.51074 Transcript_17985/m.51074 type:complete len:223 (+) Transcript_17985:562-1230(+)
MIGARDVLGSEIPFSDADEVLTSHFTGQTGLVNMPARFERFSRFCRYGDGHIIGNLHTSPVLGRHRERLVFGLDDQTAIHGALSACLPDVDTGLVRAAKPLQMLLVSGFTVTSRGNQPCVHQDCRVVLVGVALEIQLVQLLPQAVGNLVLGKQDADQYARHVPMQERVEYLFFADGFRTSNHAERGVSECGVILPIYPRLAEEDGDEVFPLVECVGVCCHFV